MRACWLFITVWIGLVLPSGLQAAQEVRVGGYDFPPYLFRPESAQPRGLLVDLLPLLNSMQSDYRFVLVPTSASRRYRDLSSGRFDLMLFESSLWGWQGTPHLSVPLPIEDAELYVALAEPGRDQSYFDDLTNKRMALYRGYHYRFADYNSDPDLLGRRFSAQMTYSHDSNLHMVLMGRADVAVITRSYLHMYAGHNPYNAEHLLISQRVDQLYQLQVLLRPDAVLDVPQVNALLRKLLLNPTFGTLLKRYYLEIQGSNVRIP
ncbi:Amino acid ABC transporter substrate-binding protein, PAAT family [Pseudomonas sp. 8Z]|uniref:substrate-binding periplasmic protein n=1 Tax=Pseudomonas sp. 8Z TaxID=2653166 RepID=UPI0012F3E075|nr:ABC transporter substrate-binding protein [Pseudomonas sp. 8Z]VXC36474.1 Amino acid ABC transporter substrate-binding protein, PAAT family [Pseudomonas sp. 8Z]